jgi:hypothetical protein
MKRKTWIATGTLGALAIGLGAPALAETGLFSSPEKQTDVADVTEEVPAEGDQTKDLSESQYVAPDPAAVNGTSVTTTMTVISAVSAPTVVSAPTAVSAPTVVSAPTPVSAPSPVTPPSPITPASAPSAASGD